jgi:preprotein translocase subunit SecB
MDNVAFRLVRYWFEDAQFHLSNVPGEKKISIDFLPSGIYQRDKGIYNLTFVFVAWEDSKTQDDFVVKVRCNAEFQFNDTIEIDEIPNFFYPNSIAIVFPYVRAFVSTLTLQANVQPMLLPTINLSSLQETLRKNTEVR